jgi:hypothetical protein
VRACGRKWDKKEKAKLAANERGGEVRKGGDDDDDNNKSPFGQLGL